MSRQSVDSLAPSSPAAEPNLERARSHLWTHGWTVIQQVVPPTVLEALTEEVDRLLSSVPLGVRSTSATDDRGQALVMNGLDARSEFLFDLSRTERFLGLAQTLLGKAAIPIHTEYFGKPGRGAEPTPPHQDQVFYENHFDDEPAITIWTPLQDVVDGGGALEYGTPCPPPRDLLPHRKSTSIDFGAELEDASPYAFVPVPVPRGACLVHHSYVVHRSGATMRDRARHVVAFNYRGSSYREYLRRASGRT